MKNTTADKFIMNQTPWIERTFTFGLTATLLPNILERLYGTSCRLENMVTGLADDVAGARIYNKWSIKEHIGHLSDLEFLHEGRIDDFIYRKSMLRAADMTNKATEQANHNLKSLDELLKKFHSDRLTFTNRLLNLDKEIQNFQSMHPRLKIPMRPVDMAHFVAEHDDHHLSSIRAIKSALGV